MVKRLVYGFNLSLSVLFTAVLLTPFFAADSKAQPTEGCPVAICTSVPGLPPPDSESQLVFFDYEYTDSFGTETFEVAANILKCPAFIVQQFGGAQITQLPRGGYSLESVECEGTGIQFVEVENGILVACDEARPELTTCTFVNRIGSLNVPTMSEWGMIGVAAALGLIGVFYAVRRRKAAA
jgi:hypothetical protein